MDLLLGVVFYGWMYATPMLLLLGLLTRTARWPQENLASAYARTTAYFVSGLVLAFGAPVVGLAVGTAARRTRWVKRFGYALGVAALMSVALAMVAGMARGPLFGQKVPAPPPPTRGCVAYSGGVNTCPGG